MKTATLVLSLLLSLDASAQSFHNPDFRAPQPVTYTYNVVGRVIAVEGPVYKTMQRQQCHDEVSSQEFRQYDTYTPQEVERSDLNSGSVVGALIGGALGSRVGKGSGRDVAIGVGAATGALMGNNRGRAPSQSTYTQPVVQRRCSQGFEDVQVGYSFVAQFEGIQIRGQMAQMPQIGQTVNITVKSTFTIENRGLQ